MSGPAQPVKVSRACCHWWPYAKPVRARGRPLKWSHLELVDGKSHFQIWLVVGPPLWKIWKSIGMMKFPTYGKIENGNQTINQKWLITRIFTTAIPHDWGNHLRTRYWVSQPQGTWDGAVAGHQVRRQRLRPFQLRQEEEDGPGEKPTEKPGQNAGKRRPWLYFNGLV